MVERKKQMMKSKRKVNRIYDIGSSVIIMIFQLVKMLMVVVTLYTLSYFPLHIVWVIFLFFFNWINGRIFYSWRYMNYFEILLNLIDILKFKKLHEISIDALKFQSLYLAFNLIHNSSLFWRQRV